MGRHEIDATAVDELRALRGMLPAVEPLKDALLAEGYDRLSDVPTSEQLGVVHRLLERLAAEGQP